MKITTFEKSPKPESMTLATDPMQVWFDRTTLLEIEKGDSLQEVANAIGDQWGLDGDEAAQLAACWFAMGERVHRKQLGAPWSKAELSTQAGRRYLRKMK